MFAASMAESGEWYTARLMSLRQRTIFEQWSPLALSWMLMGLELPAISAVMARLANPEISLAAYGGVVFPLALIVEAPVIMLLAASTSLCRDWASYVVVRRYMFWAGFALTLLHVGIAFTPLFDLVVGRIIGAPPEIQPAARIGLQIMTPWTWAIAYRRFQQGVLIRFGNSKAVGAGTIVRLVFNVSVLIFGYFVWKAEGIIVGTTAVATGVVAEAFVAGLWVQPILKGPLREAKAVEPALTMGGFLKFFVPLAMTSLITLLSMPIGSAGMSRMPRALDSLATWPVVNGMTFLFRGIGMAFNEVVVALLDRDGARPALKRFALVAGGISTAVYVLIVATPAIDFWLGRVSALEPDLVDLGSRAAWIFALMPLHAFLQSYFQGRLLQARKTTNITVAISLFLVGATLVLVAGVMWGQMPGLYVGLLGVFVGALLQLSWLRRSCRGVD